MKRLVCELCGSNDLVKTEGLFVCQNCGGKYTVEEVKKMMIEGNVDVSGSTVKVDTSARTENLRTLARRARQENNANDAKQYYELLLIEDANSWEATFYTAYYRLDPDIKTIGPSLKKFRASVSSALKLVFDTISDDKQRNEILHEILETIHQKMVSIQFQTNNNYTSSVMLVGLLSIKNGNSNSKNTLQMDIDQAIQPIGIVLNDAIRICTDIIAFLKEHNDKNQYSKYIRTALQDEDELWLVRIKIGFDSPFGELLDSAWAYPCLVDMELEFDRMGLACKTIPKIQEMNVCSWKSQFLKDRETRKRDIIKRQENEKKARIDAYWSQHIEEKQSLERIVNDHQEILNSIESDLIKLRKEYLSLQKRIDNKDVPQNHEKIQLLKQIEELRKEQISLGLLKRKQKKLLQEQILELEKRIPNDSEIDRAVRQLSEELRPRMTELETQIGNLEEKYKSNQKEIYNAKAELVKDR